MQYLSDMQTLFGTCNVHACTRYNMYIMVSLLHIHIWHPKSFKDMHVLLLIDMHVFCHAWSSYQCFRNPACMAAFRNRIASL